MNKILIGNWLLVICSIFYLAWWVITFMPPAPKGSTIGNLCLVSAFVSGLGGLFFSIREMVSSSQELPNKGLNGILLMVCGILLYIALWAFTKAVFHRQVTSELFIITGWTILQIAICNYMYSAGIITMKSAVILAIIVLITGIASLVCYVLYYELPYVKGYIDGCIPLVLVMIVMTAINIAISAKR